ncbi:hypothetical protein ACKXGF_14400 (plasmid) [Alkalibacillus sp. S2W]|uniref:hypothetical protein n=1 Tax=Alkalibacillus sp. S2W TaxID=3386553 RepID=UPI00398D4466
MENYLNQFNVFYINFEKVFEIAMLLDNEVVTTKEKTDDSKHRTKLSAKIQALLAGVFNGSAQGEYEFSKGTNLKKTVEVKSTNAIILRELISSIKLTDTDIQEAQEGQLIIIDNVQLSLQNEEETRQMKLIKQGLLDKFTHEEISVGELLKNIGQDHSYLITSKKKMDEKYLFKIPSEVESEFENGYTIDDLFIGEVSIIGIHKGQRTISDLKSTFSYLTQENKVDDDEILDSDTDEHKATYEDEKAFNYIDLLAIVQRIKF